MTKNIVAAAACAALLWAGAALAVAPEQKCQGGKNKAAGKYAYCRQKAEKGLAYNGDTAKYNYAIAKCEQKFTKAWQKEIDRATAAGTTCLDAPLVEADFKLAIDAHADIIATALAGGGMIDCPADLATCTSDLTTCSGNLTTCNANYATCSSSLSTCTTNYASCSSSLATCSAGTATMADVLVGKTFSSSAGIGATGTMPNNGALAITPGTATQTIPAGYHNGAGSVAGDADLTAGNIRIGVGLFGVTGTLGCGNGVINGSEQCDQNNLNGATCVTEGFAFGTLQCAANCVFDTSGCYTVRFTDNGDGTITDAQTGSMWQKKGDLDGVPVACTSGAVCPDPHDADNQYTYSAGSPTGPPGTAFSVMLAQLNAGGGFAGHTDWRLPTLAELQSIADYADASSPVTDAVFDTGCTASCTPTACSCTAAGLYWTDDLVASIVGNAWTVDFADGSALTDTRDTDYYARAVR
jgi:hypothetical protein